VLIQELSRNEDLLIILMKWRARSVIRFRQAHRLFERHRSESHKYSPSSANLPARHLQGADHGRGCVELADDRQPVPAVAVLPGDRSRRRLDPGCPRLVEKPGLPARTGESVETPIVSQIEDFTSSLAFRVSGAKAFAGAGITHKDVDHMMIYDAPVAARGKLRPICRSTAAGWSCTATRCTV
jgi:Thiolase C-terminal domain-like